MGERVQRAVERWINLSILVRILLGWSTCQTIQRRDELNVQETSLELQDPIKAPRSTPSDHDTTVYASLARMFGGHPSNVRTMEWYQFVMHCLQTESCLIQDISD